MGVRKTLLAIALGAGLTVLPAAGAELVGTTRVSVPAGGGQANGHSSTAAVSGDGHIVSFYSDATNLVTGDTNNARDVFVHDLASGATTRVSVGLNAEQSNGPSFAPAVSGDG